MVRILIAGCAQFRRDDQSSRFDLIELMRRQGIEQVWINHGAAHRLRGRSCRSLGGEEFALTRILESGPETDHAEGEEPAGRDQHPDEKPVDSILGSDAESLGEDPAKLSRRGQDR